MEPCTGFELLSHDVPHPNVLTACRAGGYGAGHDLRRPCHWPGMSARGKGGGLCRPSTLPVDDLRRTPRTGTSVRSVTRAACGHNRDAPAHLPHLSGLGVAARRSRPNNAQHQCASYWRAQQQGRRRQNADLRPADRYPRPAQSAGGARRRMRETGRTHGTGVSRTGHVVSTCQPLQTRVTSRSHASLDRS
jgi:hypothetical protein